MKKWKRFIVAGTVVLAMCVCPIEVQAKSANWAHIMGNIETTNNNVVKICKTIKKARESMGVFCASKKIQSYSFAIVGNVKSAKVITSKGVKKCRIQRTKKLTVARTKLRADQNYVVELTYSNNKVKFFAMDLYFLG